MLNLTVSTFRSHHRSDDETRIFILVRNQTTHTSNKYKVTLTSNQDTYQHKIYYGITETKFKQYATQVNSSGMISIKETQNLWINYGASKTISTLQMLHDRLGNTSPHYPYTKSCSFCLKEKLEIARYKGHNLLNKWSNVINKCHHRNKFVLAIYDSKDWIKFSVTAFKKPCIRSHSFPKSNCLTIYVWTRFLELLFSCAG